MRPGSIVISILALAFASAGVIWVGRSEVKVEEKKVHKELPKKQFDLGDLPSPADEGPHPKAVVPETEHNFGLMQRGESGSHEYKFINEGEVPLEVAVGNSTCQCTVGDLEGIKKIEPGESTMIKLSWKIKSPRAHFEHSAEIHTNDPKNQIVTLSIEGRVGRDFVRLPAGEWSMGTFREEEDAETSGTVFSDTKDFEVTSAECSTKLFSVEFSRVPQSEMGALVEPDRAEAAMKTGQSPLPKGAWKITVKPTGQLPMGEIRAQVRITTTLPEMKTNTIDINAKKEGPIKITPVPRKGLRYFSGRQMIDAGQFNAKDGLKIEMNLLVKGQLEKELEVEATSDPKWLEVDVKKVSVNRNVGRYLVTISVPPNKPKIVRTTTNPAQILLKTNCEGSENLPIRLAFVSQ